MCYNEIVGTKIVPEVVMTKLLRKILLAALTLCMTAGIVAVAAACGQPKNDIDYSVTVQCDDAAILSAVKVQLLKSDGTAAADAKSPDAAGKAAFTLAPATYTIKLTGDGLDAYTYPETRVTESAPSATVKLTAKQTKDTVTYTLTVQYPDGTPLADWAVSLCTSVTGEENQACYPAFTDKNGVAVLELDPGVYEVHVDNQDQLNGYTFDNKAYTMSETDNTKTVKLTAAGSSLTLTGSWLSLDGKTYTLDIEDGTLYFCSEKVNGASETDGTIAFTVGGTAYTLTRHAAIKNALTLSFNDVQELLIPKAGLSYVTVPDLFNGTWSNDASGETLYFTGNTFTAPNGEDGHVVAVTEKKTASEDADTPSSYELITLVTAKIYELSYHGDNGILYLAQNGTQTEFIKTGLGTETDARVLDQLEGNYSFELKITESSSSSSFETTYFYVAQYLKYTPKQDETYTVWDPDSTVQDYDLSLSIYTGLQADGTEQLLVNWISVIPDTRYETFTLKANTAYMFYVCAQPTNSMRGLPPLTVSFSVAKGDRPPVETVHIPSVFRGTWYNTADKTKTAIISEYKVLWNGAKATLKSASESEVKLEIGGGAWTLKLSGATLTAENGGETISFTPVPAAAPKIHGYYQGVWLNSANPDEVLAIGENYINWSRARVSVATSDLQQTIVVIDNALWRLEFVNANLKLSKTDGSESCMFQKSNALSNFKSTYLGTWKTADAATTLKFTLARAEWNGESVEIWKGKDDDCLIFTCKGVTYVVKLTVQDGKNTLQVSVLGDTQTYVLTK